MNTQEAELLSKEGLVLHKHFTGKSKALKLCWQQPAPKGEALEGKRSSPPYSLLSFVVMERGMPVILLNSCCESG